MTTFQAPQLILEHSQSLNKRAFYFITITLAAKDIFPANYEEPVLKDFFKQRKFYILTMVVTWPVLIISACSAQQTVPTVGIISALDSTTISTGLVTFAGEQKNGYELVSAADAQISGLTYKPESALSDDIQVTVRGMVEDSRQPVVAVVGATTNAGTTRSAALANFFNLPMVVPSAAGDNLLPSNNLWAFRLSAPGSAHAVYLFGEVLTRQAVSGLTTSDEFSVPLSLAILYEQNTFGEGTAVETAKAAMAQEVEIGYYGSFEPNAPDKERLIQAFSAMKDAQVHLVYLVASDPDVAQTIVRTFREFFIPDEAPLLLGQSGAFASRQFLQSAESAGVFILRQQVVSDRCPDGIETLTEAQAYAAVRLLNFAIEQSRDQLGSTDAPTLAQQREAVRDNLKASNLNLPCLGPVSFDNAGQNKNPQFELLYALSGTPRLTNPEKLLELLSPKLNFDPFE